MQKLETNKANDQQSLNDSTHRDSGLKSTVSDLWHADGQSLWKAMSTVGHHALHDLELIGDASAHPGQLASSAVHAASDIAGVASDAAHKAGDELTSLKDDGLQAMREWGDAHPTGRELVIGAVSGTAGFLGTMAGGELGPGAPLVGIAAAAGAGSLMRSAFGEKVTAGTVATDAASGLVGLGMDVAVGRLALQAGVKETIEHLAAKSGMNAVEKGASYLANSVIPMELSGATAKNAASDIIEAQTRSIWAKLGHWTANNASEKVRHHMYDKIGGMTVASAEDVFSSSNVSKALAAPYVQGVAYGF